MLFILESTVMFSFSINSESVDDIDQSDVDTLNILKLLLASIPFNFNVNFAFVWSSKSTITDGEPIPWTENSDVSRFVNVVESPLI